MEGKTAFWVFLAAMVVVLAAVGISYAYNSSITGNETERASGEGGNGLRDGSGYGRGGGSCSLGDNVSGETHVCSGSDGSSGAGGSGCAMRNADGSGGCAGCALKGTGSCTGGCHMNDADDTNTDSGCGCLNKIS